MGREANQLRLCVTPRVLLIKLLQRNPDFEFLTYLQLHFLARRVRAVVADATKQIAVPARWAGSSSSIRSSTRCQLGWWTQVAVALKPSATATMAARNGRRASRAALARSSRGVARAHLSDPARVAVRHHPATPSPPPSGVSRHADCGMPARRSRSGSSSNSERPTGASRHLSILQGVARSFARTLAELTPARSAAASGDVGAARRRRRAPRAAASRGRQRATSRRWLPLARRRRRHAEQIARRDDRARQVEVGGGR